MIISPVLIIGCARSGTTLLYNILSEAPSLWSTGYESKAIIEHFHSPAARGWESGALSAADLTPESRAYMLRAFEASAAPGTFWRRVNWLRRRANDRGTYRRLKRGGRVSSSSVVVAPTAVPQAGLDAIRAYVRLQRQLLPVRRPIRLLEKTPENCLRLPFLQALFPDARIIFLVRDARANVYSLREGWRQPHLFPGYRTPVPVTSPGQSRGRWAFTLIPGWRELVDRTLEEICARQWVACNEAVLAYADSPGALPCLRVRYEDLIAQPAATLRQISQFIDVPPSNIPAFARGLPEVNVVSRPDTEKWLAEADAIGQVEPILRPLMSRLGYT